MEKENKSYQITLIFSANLEEKEITESVQKIKQMIEKKEGKIEEIDNLAEKIISRKLSYPMQKSTDAFYLTLNFELFPEYIKEFSQELNLEKSILRYLISNKQTKAKKEKKAIKKNIFQEKEIDDIDLSSKMIDKVEPVLPEEERTEKKMEKKEKSSIEDLDKKLEEILNE